MAMSRRYFTAIAKALADTHATDATIAAVADALANTNPNFNRERFFRSTLRYESLQKESTIR